MDQAQIHIAADQLRDREESVVMPVADVADQLFCRTVVEFREMQMVMELKQEPAILLSLEAVEKSLGLRYLCIFLI